MRITQQMMMNRYGDRLNSIMGDLNRANEKVVTGRRFSRGADDPALSVQSGLLRRQYSQNSNYLDNAKEAKSRIDNAHTSVTALHDSAVNAYTDAMGADTKSKEERLILANKLETVMKTMLQQANTNTGGKFIFGGGNTKDLPFTLEGGKVSFRGIPVDSPKEIEDPNVIPPTVPPTMVSNPDFEKLQAMADEKMYTDLGFGLKVENGVVDAGSAFNTATPGIQYLGFGQDADGYSNNVIETIGKMSELLRADVVDEGEYQKLSKKFDTQRNNILVQQTGLSTNATFVDSTVARLTASSDKLNEKLVSTEEIPRELAIMELNAYDATYRAALKIGSTLLSVSFIDFMR